jgi:TPR repeat protein
MADIAQDVSGSASPEREIAPQPASRPDPEKGKLRVFISYSREDLDFADQLHAALNTYGFDSVIDRHGISGGEDWRRRLGNLIREADTVLFVLSPKSARSKICAWEVKEAERLSKRILPVICRPLKGSSPPARLRDLNYILFHADPKTPGSGFGTGLTKLVAALNADFDWLREHTRYLQRATEWDRGGRPANRLLSGDDIAEAKAWAARRPKSAPEPTGLHLDFIRVSEEEAEARSSVQRKQVDAMIAIIVKLQNQMDAGTQKEVFTVFQTGADHGDSRSMADLGRAYDLGFGVARDFAKAREWYEKAADKDDTYAMAYLGLLYANGSGVARDYAKAREWYEKAIDKGDERAMAHLGWLYREGEGVVQDYAKARELFEKAADKGDRVAMASLGLLYRAGQGVAQDYAKARELFEKAADKGDQVAMANLGLLYRQGLGVAQDYVKAREWYEKAADQGNAMAMLSLGDIYHDGHSVPQDYAKAREWYEKAADGGNTDAKALLEQLRATSEAPGARRKAP